MVDSDDYLYPGTYDRDDNDDEGYQDEIEYGNNKIVFDEESNEDSNAEEDSYPQNWRKAQWIPFGEEDDDKAEEDAEDIYSLGLVSRDLHSWMPSERSASATTSASVSISDNSTLDDEHDYEQDTHVQHRANLPERQHKRRRSQDDLYVENMFSSDQDSYDDEHGDTSRRNEDSLYSNHFQRAKTRRITSLSTTPTYGSQSSSRANYEDGSSDNITTALSHLASSSSSNFSNKVQNLVFDSDHLSLDNLPQILRIMLWGSF